MHRLLIYDSEITGHHSDYLGALVSYVDTHPERVKHLQLVLKVPEPMREMLDVNSATAAITFSDFSSQQYDLLQKSKKRQRSFLELDMIRETVAEENIDSVFLMSLDYFQRALSSKVGRRLGCDISGILFQPYTRFEKVAFEHGFLPGEFFRSLRKRLRLAALLRNPQVKRLCVPCDQSAVDTLTARYGHKLQFDMLPEPYFVGKPSPPAATDIREKYGIAAEDRIILVFGHIISRKNVPNLLRALQSSQLGYDGSITFLIIGSAREAYRKTIEQEISAFEEARAASGLNTARVVFDCGYADSALMNAAFAQTDIVAMPYFKAYQSSGILFLAARFGKPVITANAGLMNELVNQYDLGKTVDPLDPDAIAVAIGALLASPPPLDTSNLFFKQHTPDRHAACILGVSPSTQGG